VVQSGVRALALSILDSPALSLSLSYEELEARAAEPEAPEYTGGLPVGSEQFITRVHPSASPPALFTEHVRRLANDYPSTLREAREHAVRTRMHLDRLGTGADGAVGQLLSTAGDAVSEEDRARLAELTAKAEAEAEAAAASADAAASAATELATRLQAKKGAGNTAFAEGSWHEAAVRYTEALALLDGAAGAALPASEQAELTVALSSNRAACFLKLGRYEQALADTDKALGLAPAHAKAAFRKGLALQALERFEEAVPAFARAQSLEPKNGQITAALRMVEMQMARLRAAR
jgi:tetratricopeptide (TPR) repeat protein